MTMTGQASVTNHVLVTLLEARCNCNVNSTGLLSSDPWKIVCFIWLAMILLYFHKFFLSFFLDSTQKGVKSFMKSP